MSGGTPSATRARIAEAAAALIPEVGWGGVTSRVVATRAGVRPGLIHYYFDSIEELRRDAAVDGIRDFFSARIQDAMSHDEPTVAVETLLRAFGSDRSDEGGLRLLSETLVAAHRDEQLREAIAAMLEDFRSELASWLSRRGVALSASAAVTIVAAIDGFLLQRILDPDLDPGPVLAGLKALVEHDRATPASRHGAA